MRFDVMRNERVSKTNAYALQLLPHRVLVGVDMQRAARAAINVRAIAVSFDFFHGADSP
jgi:hypothetical protein